MRGKLIHICVNVRFVGITPADAGKTLILPTRSCAEKDHPRGCGENGGAAQSRRPPSGITPADAGKTRIK